jgi:5,10-methylenetetrahydrofolate reductase
MDLCLKLLDPRERIFLYGTTPPREDSPEEVVRTAASRLHERIKGLPLDGLVVYDIQDESGRTPVPRPFPFQRTIDSRIYSNRLSSLTGLPVITYKCIGQMSEPEWRAWLDETARVHRVSYLSVVGRATSRNAAGGAISLLRAIELATVHPAGLTLGCVAIAERHAERHGGLASESQRMLAKARSGCSFFISQAVYHAEPTVRMLADYARECRESGTEPRRVILTFTPCGREKTMNFIKWLGIAVPEETERAILTATQPLAKSIEICRANLREILAHEAYAHLPLGINVESVSINRDEIDASIDLFHALAEVLQKHRPRRTSTA